MREGGLYTLQRVLTHSARCHPSEKVGLDTFSINSIKLQTQKKTKKESSSKDFHPRLAEWGRLGSVTSTVQSSGLAESCPPHAARQLGSPSMKPAPCLKPVTGVAAAPVPATKPTRWKPLSRCRACVGNARYGRPARPTRLTGRGWPELGAVPGILWRW